MLPTAYLECSKASISSISFKWNIYPKLVLLNFFTEPLKIARNSE